jgi:hypothetical protein
MHCLLPSCLKKLPLMRRIRGYWYCSEPHFKRDRRRKGSEIQTDHDLRSPMRCGHCNGRIPLWRRVFAWEYCRRQCYHDHGTKPQLRPYPEATIEISHGENRLKLPRKEFLYVASAGVTISVIHNFWNRPPETEPEGALPAIPVSYNATFNVWTAEELKMWVQTSPSGPACRLDNGGLRILNTILLGAVTAIAGSLQFRLSLNDSGSAKFVLGSDPLGERCVVVELLSQPLTLTLQAWRQAAEGISRIGGIRMLARNNRNAHDMAIAFTGSAISVKIDGERMEWTGVQVDPGHIGLMGKEQDGFCVYKAAVALTT